MKEKQIVNFDDTSKFTKKINKYGYAKYYDKDGNDIGCQICYVHSEAEKYFEDDDREENQITIPHPRCPKCGNLLERRYYWTSDNCTDIVSEVNYSNPEGEIGLYSIWECNNEECCDNYGNEQIYALMPIPIVWNANHDIYYTGGKDFIIDKELEELCSLIYENIMPSILQYIDRKLDPKDVIDKNLDKSNIKLWCSRDVKRALAEYLYSHGMKK